MFLIIDKRKDNNSTQNSVGQIEQVRESVLFSSDKDMTSFLKPTTST